MAEGGWITCLELALKPWRLLKISLPMPAFRKRLLKMVGVFLAVSLLLLPVWDWSRYWLPAGMEERLFFPGDAWISIPEEGSLAARIAALREWKDARAVKKEERAANVLRWKHFETFDFANQYLSCENSLEGRWFLHFGEDGVVRTAVPGDKRFAMDNQKPDFPVIDLSELFVDPTTYRRVDGRTIEFSNSNGTWILSMTPILDEVDGDLKFPSLESCCDRIIFESLASPEIRFELWRDERNPSEFEFFSKQGNK